MKTCLNCHQENPPRAKFCNNCGASLTTSDTVSQRSVPSDNLKAERSAERRQLTILFCDMVGSTQLSEQLDAEEYRQIIIEYHQVVEQIIKRYSGHVASYLGDGLLVYFGYPEGLEDAPKVSIQAGLSCIEAIVKANRDWETEGRNPLKIRIGIHTGLVVVDDHLALGDTVNIAARLEALAPHNGMVISNQTLKLAQGWFEFESLGEHSLKGISEPMEVFRVLKETGAKSPLEAAKSRGLSPLVGRQAELDVLKAHWLQAKTGQGDLTLLNGEAGIGKSRLVDAIKEQIILDGDIWVAEARCSAYHRNSSFYPIIDLLGRAVLQFEQNDPPEAKLKKLKDFLQDTDLDLQLAMPLFAEFLSIPSEEYPPPMMSPFAKKQKILEGLTQLLIFSASQKPGLLVVEDLHWADASTLEWLGIFIEKLPSLAIFTICTTRPTGRSYWPGRSDIDQIDLQRLTADKVVEICTYQSRGKTLPPQILDQITRKTEGVPLFVEELTKMIIESDLLVEKADSYELEGALGSLAIPSTLQDSLLARLDRLSTVKEIVQVGAVLGREFSHQILDAVLSEKTDDLEQTINKLLDAEILYRHKKGKQTIYQFKHALIQDAAYESLLKSRRQQLHNRVAKVLEHQFGDVLQSQPELLAHHLTEAGLPLQAITYWLSAGQLASRKNATSEAIAHLEKGMSLLSHVKDEAERNNLALDFLVTLGGSYVVSLGFPHPKVKQTFDQATEIAQTIDISPKLALIQLNLLSYYFNTEDFKAHEELAKHMLKLARDTENGYWFELFARQGIGLALIIRGELKAADQYFHDVSEMVDPSLPFPWELTPSGHIEVASSAWHMICFQILGYMDRAKILSENHLLKAEDHQDSVTLYHIYTFPALRGMVAREWETSEKIMEEYLPVVRAFGDPIFTLTAEVYYYIAKAFQGDKSAFDTAIHLVNVCFDVGFKAFAVTMAPYIAEQYYRIAEYDSALSWIEKILDHVNVTGTHVQTAELYRIKGLTLKAIGESDEMVEKSLQLALEISRNQAAKTYELRAACDLARHWQKPEKSREAYHLLEEVYHWFTEGFDSKDLQQAKTILDKLEVENTLP